MQKAPLIAWILLIVLAIIWGSSFILIKKGLIGLSPEEVGSLRILSAALILSPFGIARIRSTENSKILYLLGAGLLGSLLPAFLFAIAQTKLESAVTGVLNGLVPIFTILIGLFLFGQKQTPKVWIGVFVGFIGTFILVTAGSSGFSGFNGYALLVILASFCYASNLNLIKMHLSQIPALSVTSISLLLVGPIAAIHLFFFTEFSSTILYDKEVQQSAFYIVLLGILGTAIALIIFNRILQMTSALFTSSVTYIIPAIAIFWGLLDNEIITFTHYIGMAAVGAGVYIANSNRAAFKTQEK